jgi:hypothetical protein
MFWFFSHLVLSLLSMMCPVVPFLEYATCLSYAWTGFHCMSALVDAAEHGDVTEVRLLKEGLPLRPAALWAAANNAYGDFPVAKCLIKEGGINIDAVITRGYPETTLSWAASAIGVATFNYPLIQWL